MNNFKDNFFCKDIKSGLSLVFMKFLPGFLIFFQIFKSTYFSVYFLFKNKLKVKNCVKLYNYIENIHETTLNVFFIEKKY